MQGRVKLAKEFRFYAELKPLEVLSSSGKTPASKASRSLFCRRDNGGLEGPSRLLGITRCVAMMRCGPSSRSWWLHKQTFVFSQGSLSFFIRTEGFSTHALRQS